MIINSLLECLMILIKKKQVCMKNMRIFYSSVIIIYFINIDAVL